MKLEEELHSSKPLPARQRALLNLLFTASWLDCQIARKLRPFRLTPPQYNILRILNGSSPRGLSVLDIKGRMIDRSSNVSRLVEKLRLAGLAERGPHGDDRRMVTVTISSAGKQLLSDIEQAQFMDGQGVLGSQMDEAEFAQLAALLDKLRE